VKKLSRPLVFTLSFAALGLVWRLLFLPVSQSSYTDGILQVDMFRQGLSYWPPLFALMARALAWLPGVGLEGAGRLVALLAGVLILFPLCAAARRLFGLRAAFWAMAAWLASPMALRWSLQCMTDMPALALWTAALAALILGLEQYLPGLFPQAGPAPEPSARTGNQWLLIASLTAALATLTRYQGILLLPLILVAVWTCARVARSLPTRAYNAWLTLLPWLAVAGWGALQGMRSLAMHRQQIGQRASVVSYWEFFESFLLIAPYFVTYGLFGFFLYGLFRTQWSTARLRWTAWACLYLGLAVLVGQSIFQSFQERYLLPLLPLICLFAGHGLAVWERRCERHPLRFWGLAGPTLAWGLLFSALVAVEQGSPFLDLKQAALEVRRLNRPAAQVFSNETFNPLISTVKTSFWSGRSVTLLDSEAVNAGALKPGDLIVLSSYNAGGLEAYRELKAQLIQGLPARPIHESFARTALPLLPDIMQESGPKSGTAQSPAAWYFRNRRQYFETALLEVQAASGAEPLRPIPPRPAGESGAIKQLEELQKAAPKR